MNKLISLGRATAETKGTYELLQGNQTDDGVLGKNGIECAFDPIDPQNPNQTPTCVR